MFSRHAVFCTSLSISNFFQGRSGPQPRLMVGHGAKHLLFFASWTLSLFDLYYHDLIDDIHLPSFPDANHVFSVSPSTQDIPPLKACSFRVTFKPVSIVIDWFPIKFVKNEIRFLHGYFNRQKKLYNRY